ncbi:MAG TPA: hypothetical protein VEI02_00980 [Planctomycetota bacterium]|nr:hypothetical protein [Planctomycetota bacterium]
MIVAAMPSGRRTAAFACVLAWAAVGCSSSPRTYPHGQVALPLREIVRLQTDTVLFDALGRRPDAREAAARFLTTHHEETPLAVLVTSWRADPRLAALADPERVFQDARDDGDWRRRAREAHLDPDAPLEMVFTGGWLDGLADALRRR